MPPHDIGRKCIIILLDDQKIETYVHYSLAGGELVELVANQFHLKEREYFGLCLDGTENAPQWLELERPVLEQDVPSQGVLWLRFQVRYYVESVAWLKDSVAVEMFYLQCKQNVFRGLTVCGSDVIFQLAAFVMQATYGDFTMHQAAKEDLKRLPVIPASTLKEHPNTSFCESEIIHIYEYLQSKSRGIAILSYLNTVIQQPTFGLHCYEVRDKADQPFLLGLSPKGLGVYDQINRSVLLELFEWKNLENIYHRDKKFSIEVYQQASSQTATLPANARQQPSAVGPSQLARGGPPRNLVVHVWYSTNPRLLRSLFNTAKGQHQLYLSKRATRANSPSQCRSPSQMAQELSLSTMSLDSSSNLTGSTNSLLSTGSKGTNTPVVSEENQAAAQAAARLAEREMYLALAARREALRQKLARREEELRQLGKEEERILNQHSRKSGNHVPRIASASYKFSESMVNSTPNTNNCKNRIEELKKELQIQQTIISAATKLCTERGLSRNVKRERKENLKKCTDKLRDVQSELNFLETHQSTASRSREGGLNDTRSDSPAAYSLPALAPSTVSQSPTPSSEEVVRPKDRFISQADEDFVASLIAGDRPAHSSAGMGMARASPAAGSPIPPGNATAVLPRVAGSPAGVQLRQPMPVGQPARLAGRQPQHPSSLVGPSIVPIARERLRSLAQKRESFLMEDPIAPTNGYPSRPDSSSSEDEDGRSRKRDPDVLSWLDDNQLFGQGTLV